MDSIFKKSEAHVARGTAMETHCTKRVKIGNGPLVTMKEAVPSFVAEKPLRIDDDPSPIVVTWGLQRKDTVTGSLDVVAVWSESVVTLRGRIKIVESSDDSHT